MFVKKLEMDWFILIRIAQFHNSSKPSFHAGNGGVLYRGSCSSGIDFTHLCCTNFHCDEKAKDLRSNYLLTVIVYITKLILNKEHLKHTAVSVAEENMVITRGAQHKQFGKTTGHQSLGTLLQRVYIYRLGS